MDKEYRPIPGFEKYGIAIDGEVKHLRTGHIKTPCLNKAGGYYIVNLYDATGKLCRPLVHRLVALVYLPNPNNWPQVNHKDENKFNNNVDNLEWCTSDYNLNYGTRLQRISGKNTGQTRTYNSVNRITKPIAQIDKTHNIIIAAFKSVKDAAAAMNMGTTLIRDVANHKQYCHTAGGYRWEFITFELYKKFLNQEINLQDLIDWNKKEDS